MLQEKMDFKAVPSSFDTYSDTAPNLHISSPLTRKAKNELKDIKNMIISSIAEYIL